MGLRFGSGLRSGIYALASLDGAPLSPADLAVLHLDDPVEATVLRADGFAGRVYDRQNEAIDILQTADGVTLFAGFLDEPEELRGLLGLAEVQRPAVMAAAALARFGAEAPGYLLGEWSLLQWRSRPRELTALISEARRDMMFFTMGRGLVALAPSALMLTDLRWVGRALDPVGMALSASRAGLRHIKTDQTMWRGVREVAPGTRSVFTFASRIADRMSDPAPPQRFTGSFQEAIEEIEAVGRHIVRQHLTRHRRCAFLLSGGLDSTLLTSWGALERGSGREIFCLTSMAQPGSGLPDESEWSTAAANMLGVSLEGVWPAPDANLYQPEPEIFAQLESSPDSRFRVWQALNRAAVAGGASAFLQGSGGEMHISNGFEEPETRSWPRIQAAAIRDKLARRRRYSGWPAAAFHLAFSPELLVQLPPEWEHVWRRGPASTTIRTNEPGKNDPPIGISRSARKMAFAPSASPQGTRLFLPYRDQRLLRAAAGIPASFLRYNGLTRPIARMLLKGRVPDAVRLRKRGRPFSPDFVQNLKAQASSAKSRIPIYRDAGIGRWLNITMLPACLDRLASSEGEKDYNTYYHLHGTMLFAEFLLWAASQKVSL